VNKLRIVALAVAANAVLLSCTSNTPTNITQPAASSSQPASQAAAEPTQQRPVKPQHECVSGEVSQSYMADIARLEGEPSAQLNYCFVSGYRGIGCPDDWSITHAVGHALSNRERAGCDAIMGRIERQKAADEARKKRLDEAYDKQHGLKPSK
jgi:hypothetical protein